MKKAILVALAACALLAFMAGAAYAASWGAGSYPNTAETGHTWSDITGDGSAYFDTTVNPHAGFDVGTHQCTVCHSVHHASLNGEALLPDTVANACIYCHVAPGTAGYISIYDGNPANYTTASDNAHDSESGVTCTDCHQVHAASAKMVSAANGYGADMPYLVTKLLKVDGTGQDLVDSTATVLAFAGTEADEVAVSMWCTSCHKVGDNGLGVPYGYFNDDPNTMSHVMRDPTVGGYTNAAGVFIGVVANATSVACSSCHNRGEINTSPVPPATVASQYNFPHFSDGVRFLTAAATLDATGVPDSSGAATDAHADGVCIQCHRGASLEASGVGIGF